MKDLASQSQPGSDAPRALPSAVGSPEWWLLERLYRLQLAASEYYDGYCQDEADDDGPDFTGCSVEQHLAAKELRDALRDCALDETMRAVQVAAQPVPTRTPPTASQVPGRNP